MLMIVSLQNNSERFWMKLSLLLFILFLLVPASSKATIPVGGELVEDMLPFTEPVDVPPPPPVLNENCVVSILNRTAQVRPDGTWLISNVPTNFGQVRARATCVVNGVTYGGQSELFTVPQNGIVTVGEIQFAALTPIPTALRVTAPTTILTTAGATAQLSVIATLSDGSTLDVTAASVGTNYTTSNPAVATVSPDGLIAAVSSGTVIVSATHEGVLGLIRLQVALSGGDTDSDGIPDDIEQANGLNPNDPVDGFLDADGDGLTNKQELVDVGTNFQVADSDGDTIADGEEALPGTDGFVTNPLLRDTDGDGSDDAAEIAAGSDPTDPASRPALVAIEVSPTNFTLTVNTIIGEASQKLTVTGRRADGSTVNLTADPGTNYTSSDLTICNFGTEKGRVFASNNGACTITVTNGNLSAQSSITVRTFAPVPLSFVSIPGFANNVDVSGDYAYVAAGATGLQVVDVTNPTTPILVSSENTPGNANDVIVVEDLAYVADGSSGLQIIDISDPLDPIIIGAVDTPGVAQDVAVKANLALVADGSTGLQVIDITDPTAPRLIGSVDTPGTAKGVAVSQDAPRAVIADGSGGIQVIDLTDPTNPTSIGNVSTGGNARDVTLNGNFAFIADTSSSFTVVDLSNPTAPVVRASTPSTTGGLLTDVVQAGRFAFGADVFFVNGVPIIDVSVPATPIPRAILDFSSFRDDNGTGIAVDGSFVYLTAEQGTITENGTTGNTRLYIGQYLALEDTAGITPTVSITSPASGETVVEGATLPITVAATDDVTVAAVNLLVNGILVSTDTTAPYQFTLTVPTGVSSLTLGAAAGDVGGNVGTAQDVMVNVIPDPLTTVIGRVLAQGGNPVAGATVNCAEVSALTGADGAFSIPAVPTITGAIRCTAVFVTPQGETLGGTSPRAVFPVSGGVTDVGDIVVVPGFVPGAGPLYPGPVFPVSGDPVSVTMADLNGDQIADLITANRASNDVAVLSGNGNGTFQSPQRFAVGTSPTSVAVGDLNGDGIADIVVANGGTSQDVSVLRGNGNGTFQTQQRFTVGTGASPRSVAVADVNGDGLRDVVTANSSNDVSVLLGNGNGTLQTPRRFAVGTSPQSVAVGDLNGDGVADVVTANSASNDVSVLLGNTNGTLEAQQRFVVGTSPQSVAIADLNGDMIADLVSANQISQNVSVLLGNGNGTFQTQQQFAVGTSPRSVAVADFNGDGSADLVTANFLVSDAISVSVLLGNGNGAFQSPQRFGVGGSPDSLAVGELNGDGMVDVVTASQAADAVTVLLGNGDGTLLAQRRFAVSGATSIAVGDFNSDTIADLVTNRELDTISVLLGNGDGTFQAQRVFSSGGRSPQAVAVGDFNGDGSADVVTAHFTSNNVSVRLGNGNATFQSVLSFAVSTGPISVAVGDVNGDNLPDIVTANDGSNNISVLLGNGNGAFQTQRVLTVGSDPIFVAVADLNGDGTADVVTANSLANNVSVLLSNGDGTFQAPRLFATGTCSSVAVADLNSDTIADLVTANNLGNVSVLLGNGDGTFRPEQRFAADLNARSVAVADLNGDGAPDLVTTSSSGRNSISVLLGNGDGTFRPEQRFATGVGPSSVAAADFNGDGAPDLVTANGDVSVLLQQ
jgi:hypothetical protein